MVNILSWFTNLYNNERWIENWFLIHFLIIFNTIIFLRILMPEKMINAIIQGLDSYVWVLSILTWFVWTMLSVILTSYNITDISSELQSKITEKTWVFDLNWILNKSKKILTYYTYLSMFLIILWYLLIIIWNWINSIFSKSILYHVGISMLIYAIWLLYLNINWFTKLQNIFDS